MDDAATGALALKAIGHVRAGAYGTGQDQYYPGFVDVASQFYTGGACQPTSGAAKNGARLVLRVLQ